MASYHHHHHHLHRQVNPAIWKSCAGTSVQIPAVHSRVYYFPQGHVEQSCSSIPPSFSPLVTSRPFIHCRVLEVLFLADPDTDEVFTKILLQPIPLSFVPEPSRISDDDSEKAVVSFAKVLTPSDANNGGGFSVPRFCADSIFPPLDYGADPPVQNIRIFDIHGEGWDFRHIYRGTPRRHLLTTGWSKFVNSKKLIAGDSVVFIRDKVDDNLFVGLRRAVKSNYSNETSNWASHFGVGSSGGGGGFWRNGRVRVRPEAVVEAAERAASNLAFEVVYYPRAGLPDFVVSAEKVEAAMRVYWSSGMRVKMAMETEDSSRMTWFQGTVASLVVPDRGLWRGSPWRMLQVAWDEPETLQNMKRVSPWQVEVVASVPPVHTASPPAKKFRAPLNSGLLTDGEGDFPLSTIGLGSMTGQLSSSYLNYSITPAGMQGARQNPFFVSSLPNIMNTSALRMCPNDYMEKMSLKVGASVSTDLNIGSSPSNTSSPDSQNGVELFGIDTTRNSSSNLTRKVGITSFQLFGKIIHMEQPPTDDISSAKYDDSTTGVTRKSIDHSLSNPCKKLHLHDRLGAQCQRSSVVETYAL